MKTRKVMQKSAIILLGSLFTLSAAAFAADKFAVRNDANTADVVTVNGNGNTGFNFATPNYAVDVVTTGNANKSQLHFSLSGADSGGWITSVNENNFWISSGAVFDGPAGGWIQKSSDGKSVFFGSGAAGFRAYMNQGNTAGAPMTNVNQVMLVDYSGNLTMNGGVQINNSATALTQPTCTTTIRGMLWMKKSAAGVKDIVQICAQGTTGALGWQNLSF